MAYVSSLTCPTQMTLTELLERYTAAIECSERYVESLRRTVKKAQANGIEKICQLDSDAANDMLSKLRLAATTRHNIRRELLTLWRFAFERGWTDVFPGRVRRIRPVYAPVRAWTPCQLLAMLAAAEADMTPISRRTRLQRRDVLPAWIMLNYDSGMRFEDIRCLHANDFRNGHILLNERKTQKPVVRAISEETQLAVARLFLHSPDGTLFRWLLPRRRAFLVWRSFLDENGFGGSTKWFRRTAATQVHKKERGAAKEFLRHSAEYLQYRHYIDMSQIENQVSPPPLLNPISMPKPR